MPYMSNLYRDEYTEHFFTTSGFLGAMFNPKRYEAIDYLKLNGMIILRDTDAVTSFINKVSSLNNKVFHETSALRSTFYRDLLIGPTSNFMTMFQTMMVHNKAVEDGADHLPSRYTWPNQLMSIVIVNDHFAPTFVAAHNIITPIDDWVLDSEQINLTNALNMGTRRLIALAIPRAALYNTLQEIATKESTYIRNQSAHEWNATVSNNLTMDIFDYRKDAIVYRINKITPLKSVQFGDFGTPLTMSTLDTNKYAYTDQRVIVDNRSMLDYVAGVRSTYVYHMSHPFIDAPRGLKIDFSKSAGAPFKDTEGDI